jgi:uncharacterized membrane protein YgcG
LWFGLSNKNIDVMKKKLLLIVALSSVFGGVYAQDEFDDIYYNPAQDKTSNTYKGTTHGNSYYVADMSLVDIDAYNRRGESYYATPIDTIGTTLQNGEDFVYSQQIQKFYNPTIVVNNLDVLNEVIENSYGNVEIVYDGVTPTFAVNYGYYDPYYYAYTPYWSLGWGGRLLWNLYGPSYSWYNPWYVGWSDPWFSPWLGYSWHSPYYWGWTWGWGGGWDHHHDGHWTANHWRPNGNSPAGAGRGWASATQHRGGNMGMPGNRGNGIAQNGNFNGGHRNAGNVGDRAVLNNNFRGDNRFNNGRTLNGNVGVQNNRYQGTTGVSNHRTNKSVTTTRPNTSTSNRQNNTYTPSRNTNNSSSGNHRSSGGGFSGGSRGGGGGSHGGGSHGGGGHR